MTSDAALLEVTGLKKHFAAANRGVVRAVDGISFSVAAGTTLALVGETGCGKTTTARMILLLEKPTEGTITIDGQEVTGLRRSELQSYRKSVQAVFQDPFSSLSPRMRVADIVSEPLQIHENLRGSELEDRVAGLLEDVGLKRDAMRQYPHQFSGGQRQRIAIARALSLRPKLIVLDEPVSALDVSTRAQILNLLVDLQDRFGLSYLLISHDLAIVNHMSHRVAVMYSGQIVEIGDGSELFERTLHPYSQSLIAAVPQPDPDIPLAEIVSGEVADPANPPSGCKFHPRCPRFDQTICPVEVPAIQEISEDHLVACHKVTPDRAVHA